MARVVRVVMLRLQRVTFLALHQYLGLDSELLSTQDLGGPVKKHSGGFGRPSSVENHKVNLAEKEASPISFSDVVHDEPSDPALLPRVKEAYRSLLGLEHDALTKDEEEFLDDIDFATYEAEEVLVYEETVDTNCLMLVLCGTISVIQRREDSAATVGGVDSEDTNDSYVEMHKVKAGGLLGQLQVLTGEPSFFTYK